MKRKPIRVDWDELEAAFENPNDELVYYLDLVNGHVVLEGEGEEDDYDDDGESYSASPPAPVDDNTRAYVDRVTTEIKLEWLGRFLDEGDDLDPGWTDKLRACIDADDPTQAIIETLSEDPEGKEAWYRFRSERIHDRIDEWLEREEVNLVEPPPWA